MSLPLPLPVLLLSPLPTLRRVLRWFRQALDQSAYLQQVLLVLARVLVLALTPLSVLLPLQPWQLGP